YEDRHNVSDVPLCADEAIGWCTRCNDRACDGGNKPNDDDEGSAAGGLSCAARDASRVSERIRVAVGSTAASLARSPAPGGRDDRLVFPALGLSPLTRNRALLA